MSESIRRRPIVGRPLWFRARIGPREIGFLQAEIDSELYGRQLIIGLLKPNQSMIVPEATCYLAEFTETKGDWTGTICTFKNWGAGVIQSSTWDEEKQEPYVVISTGNGDLKACYLSEVTLCLFSYG
jgi:hypothetical protein